MQFTTISPRGLTLSETKIGRFSCYTASASPSLSSIDCAASLVLPASDAAFTAVYQKSPYWMDVQFGERFPELKDLTAALLVRTERGFRYLIAAAGDRMKCAMRGCPEGIELRLFSGVAETSFENAPFFLLGEGEDPAALIAEGAKVLCTFLNNGLKLRSEKKYPEVFEKIGWCSWDAFQIRVSEKGLLEKAAEFTEKRVPISFAILDDMWADVPGYRGVPALNDLPEDIAFSPMVEVMHKSPLYAFEGDPVRFPAGMAGCVSKLKAAGVSHVGLWFPTTGYWAGLIPDSPVAREQAENTVTLPDGRIFPKPTEECAERFYSLFCQKAKDFGCDFVKIDNQGFHHHFKNLYPLGETSRAVQHAIDRAAFANFGGALINCMGMPTECMFHRKDSAVARCSDDFMPESAAWFSKNVLECSFNGILQGQFYYNDWDMWWTDDRQAKKNSLCRAVSGGPIYVSDKLGRTRPEMLSPVCFDDGRILRPDDSALPTEDCLIGDPTKEQKLFKIYNRIGKTGVVACFSLCEESPAVSGTVSAKDAGLPEGKYLWYEHFTKKSGVLPAGKTLSVSLKDKDDVRHFTLIPYEENTPAVIGRTDKFNARFAVVSERKGAFTLYEGGECSVYSEKPLRFYADGSELPAVQEENHLWRITSERRETEITYETDETI